VCFELNGLSSEFFFQQQTSIFFSTTPQNFCLFFQFEGESVIIKSWVITETQYHLDDIEV